MRKPPSTHYEERWSTRGVCVCACIGVKQTNRSVLRYKLSEAGCVHALSCIKQQWAGFVHKVVNMPQEGACLYRRRCLNKSAEASCGHDCVHDCVLCTCARARVCVQRGGGGGEWVGGWVLFVVCLTSQHRASVSQRWIRSGNCTCCHTGIDVFSIFVFSLIQRNLHVSHGKAL